MFRYYASDGSKPLMIWSIYRGLCTFDEMVMVQDQGSYVISGDIAYVISGDIDVIAMATRGYQGSFW